MHERAKLVRSGRVSPAYNPKGLGARQAPEMVRVPLEELVLQIHLLRLGPAGGFLARVLEPPPAKSVAGALAALAAIGALTPDERLTPLGARPSCRMTRKSFDLDRAPRCLLVPNRFDPSEFCHTRAARPHMRALHGFREGT